VTQHMALLNCQSSRDSCANPHFGVNNSLWIAPLSETAIARVALAMRPADRVEIFSGRWEYDPIEMTRQICRFSTLGAVASTPDGTPVAVVNAVAISPAVLSVGMFTTTDWPRIARPFSRWCKTTFKAALLSTGARRAEAWSLVGHRSAHAWLMWFGFKPECEATRGKAGERFILFGWER
jgi:hypothetical protein